MVSDETLRETMATIEDPEAVTRQLIELALHGGGPDNITCIVADVVDTATSRVPPTGTPVLAGAAASAHDPRLSTDGTGPFGGAGDHQGNHYTDSYEDDGQPSLTVARPMVALDDLDPDELALALASENGTDMTAVRARRSHRAQPRRARRRRWPIVTTSLVVLLAVVIGGGYVAWRWSQDQYYVGADGKDQEVSSTAASTSTSPGSACPVRYQQTGIKLTQVPPSYQQTVRATDTASNLRSAQAIVANIRSAVSTCQQEYATLQQWVVKDNAYQAAVALARKQHKSAKDIAESRASRGRARSRPGPRCASLPPPSASRPVPSSRPQGPREQHHRPVAGR